MNIHVLHVWECNATLALQFNANLHVVNIFDQLKENISNNVIVD